MYDGFASNFDEWFWGSKCMWAHALAHAGHWDDEFHKRLMYLNKGKNGCKGKESK
jgi:hypothetical protein